MINNAMIFFVTVPDIKLGEELAFALVKAKIAACVNIVKGITSIYTWKEKIEKDSECFLIIKTTDDKSDELIKYIEDNHPYDTPECIGLKIEEGSRKYLEWISSSVK
jgi:periplasmic divalent cation tolerance protein